MFLVLRGTPAAIDVELDPVVRGIRCSLAQGAEESWIKVGYTRNLVIKDRRTVGDGTVSLTKRAVAAGTSARLGGLVEAGTLRYDPQTRDLRFAIGDGVTTVTVVGKRTTVLTAKDVDG